jgi:beta-N-acetylhexosaminidase
MITQRLTLHERNIGQLMIVGFDGTKMTRRLSSLLTGLQPAGVILFARNIKNAQQTWELLSDCQNCVSAPLFTCVDLEGGTVDRLRDVLGPAPSPADVFATADRKLFRKHGQVIAENCRALGFNLDFAPVLDLAFESSRKVMGSRSVSSSPVRATAYAREFLAGLRKAAVLGCGKHFPGLGEGKLDSHHGLPVIDKPLKTLWSEDLRPYRTLRAQMPLVMISHAAYPLVTKNRTPASLSKIWITDILRKRIGYRHLIVSDDLEMGGVLAAASVAEAAVEFVRAGGDLCLICHREDQITEAYEQLMRTAQRDSKFAARAAASALRILNFKKKSAQMLRRSKAPSAGMVETLSRRLWEFGEQVQLAALVHAEKDRTRQQRNNIARRARA